MSSGVPEFMTENANADTLGTPHTKYQLGTYNEYYSARQHHKLPTPLHKETTIQCDLDSGKPIRI